MANRVIQARQTVIDSRYLHLAKWCVSEMHELGHSSCSCLLVFILIRPQHPHKRLNVYHVTRS